MARATKDDKRIYIGTYKSEEVAAIARDKVTYYFYGDKKKFNFPEKVNENYAKEGQEIYEAYTNPLRQQIRSIPKSSRYNGVNKRSSKTWEMALAFNKKRIREVYLNEMDAALAHDYYLRLNNGNLNRLNFPKLINIEKPMEFIVRGQNNALKK